MPIVAILLVVLAAGWRVLAAHAPELGNFCPLVAVAFCGGVYFRNRSLWAIPFLALALSDLYLDHYYLVQFHYRFELTGALLRLGCFGAALALGRWVAGRRSWPLLVGGTLASSLFFYLVTNTASWASDQGYAHTAAGWWQALTIGHPQFAPTLVFFRHSLASDLLFTVGFALILEALALRRGEPSLLGAPRASAP